MMLKMILFLVAVTLPCCYHIVDGVTMDQICQAMSADAARMSVNLQCSCTEFPEVCQYLNRTGGDVSNLTLSDVCKKLPPLAQRLCNCQTFPKVCALLSSTKPTATQATTTTLATTTTTAPTTTTPAPTTTPATTKLATSTQITVITRKANTTAENDNISSSTTHHSHGMTIATAAFVIVVYSILL